jgi:hypothetical protein
LVATALTVFNEKSIGHRRGGSLLCVDEGATVGSYRNSSEDFTAPLSTCFCHTRYMLYRPFKYEVLHFPELAAADEDRYHAIVVQKSSQSANL